MTAATEQLNEGCQFGWVDGQIPSGLGLYPNHRIGTRSLPPLPAGFRRRAQWDTASVERLALIGEETFSSFLSVEERHHSVC